jgi:hypothetical protein
MVAQQRFGFGAISLMSVLSLQACAGGSSNGDDVRAVCLAGSGDPSAPWLDDFEDGDRELLQSSNRRGWWYANNDGTGIQAPPPDATGQQPFLLSTPGSPKSPKYALRTVGWGFTGWGAFVSANLNSPSRTLCSYDVSGFSGLQFQVKGNGSLRVAIGTQATTPVVDGGQCGGDNCSDFGAVIALREDWMEVSIAFTELSQPSWASSAPWTPSEAVRLSYWVPEGDFDFWIDDVQFY